MLEQRFGADQHKDITSIVENSYFFGQFMLLHLIQKIIANRGMDDTIKFIDRKYKQIGFGNPEFVIKAEQIVDANSDQYYRDTMEASAKSFIKKQ